MHFIIHNMARNPIVDRVDDVVIALILSASRSNLDARRLTVLFVTVKIRSSPAMP
jgi:hypothetical protein